jgi:hypothetical protein
LRGPPLGDRDGSLAAEASRTRGQTTFSLEEMPMIVIHGHKWEMEFKRVVKHPCPACQRPDMELHFGHKKFTLYWIPTFTLESSYLLKCKPCDSIWTLPQSEGELLEKNG